MKIKLKLLSKISMLSILYTFSMFAFSQADIEEQLFSAIESKDYDLAKSIVNENIGLNLEFEIDGSPLIMAIKNQDLGMTEFLLEKGADPDFKGYFFYHPIVLAIVLKNHEIAEALLQYDLDLSVRETGAIGKTPLLFAAEYGDITLLDLLLENGADINIKDNFGDRALAFAAFHGQLEMVKHLVSLGVDVVHENRNNKTALIHAGDRGHTEIVKYLESL